MMPMGRRFAGVGGRFFFGMNTNEVEKRCLESGTLFCRDEMTLL